MSKAPITVVGPLLSPAITHLLYYFSSFFSFFTSLFFTIIRRNRLAVSMAAVMRQCTHFCCPAKLSEYKPLPRHLFTDHLCSTEGVVLLLLPTILLIITHYQCRGRLVQSCTSQTASGISRTRICVNRPLICLCVLDIGDNNKSEWF